MTSSDIYYRLGRIEGDIHTLQTDVKDLKEGQTRLEDKIDALRKENKEDLRDQRTELKGDITEFRGENSEEHRAMRSEFKADIAEVKTEIAGLRAEMHTLRSDLITSIGIWFSLFAVIITAVSISVPLLINHFNNKKEKEKVPQTKEIHEHEPIFSLNAIKSLIDYYKTGK